MEKFSNATHADLQKKLSFSYFSTPIYLDFAAYVFEKNGESLVVSQDILFQNEFPCLFLPKKKENWEYCSTTFVTEEEVAAIKREHIEILVQKSTGNEFYYRTEDFIHPKGSLKTRAHQFASQNKFELTHEYDTQKIREFYAFWKSQRVHTSVTFDDSEDFFFFCLGNLKKYDVKQIYVEVDHRLVGIAWGVRFPGSTNWIGLHLKADYRSKGLSRFLHHERAKLFGECEEFSLGTGAFDAGIDTYKKELGPAYEKAYFYVLTSHAPQIPSDLSQLPVHDQDA